VSYLDLAHKALTEPTVDVPFPCLTCGVNLEEGVLYCPVCWVQKQVDREARRVLLFDPNRARRTPTVRDQITGSDTSGLSRGEAPADTLASILPIPCLSGPVSGSGGAR
jgi:hypothetical protein